MKLDSVDIVIPVYGSASVLPKLYQRLESWIESQYFSVHVIFVIDASPDDSKLVLSKLISEKKERYKIISLSENVGQHTATYCGLIHASADWVVTIDDDLQHDPFEINKLLDVGIHEDCDLVFGKYVDKKHGLFRNLGTTLLQLLLRFTEVKNYQGVGSFRLIHRSLINKISHQKTRVLFLDGLLMRSSTKKRISNVIHAETSRRNSNYSFWKLFKFGAIILIRFSKVPEKGFHFFAYLGLFMVVLLKMDKIGISIDNMTLLIGSGAIYLLGSTWRFVRQKGFLESVLPLPNFTIE
ncbi:MAG: hypothetical protein RL264_823 [Bacteroidota bacterium]